MSLAFLSNGRSKTSTTATRSANPNNLIGYAVPPQRSMDLARRSKPSRGARFAPASPSLLTLSLQSTDQSTSESNDQGPPENEDRQGESEFESDFEHIHVMDDFLDETLVLELRETFESRFQNGSGGMKNNDNNDPQAGESGGISTRRFVWDAWHVPDQFSLLRTPAEEYFGSERFDKVVDALTEYGRRHLGCNSLSPGLWLSLYTDGAEQRWHTDAWQGPWAFVLSLTPDEAFSKNFVSGGETVIMAPETLSYWSGLDAQQSLEERHLMDDIPPLFNRLTVFDPRFPHCVRKLQGSRDPLHGRLVLHGWFTSPEPYIDGPLSEDQVAQTLNVLLTPFYEQLEQDVLPQVRILGMFAVRITVSGVTGEVQTVEALSDTLLCDPASGATEQEGAALLAATKAMIAEYLQQDEAGRRNNFPVLSDNNKDDTKITIPFVFE